MKEMLSSHIVTAPSFFRLFPVGIISPKNECTKFHPALLNVYQWLFFNNLESASEVVNSETLADILPRSSSVTP